MTGWNRTDALQHAPAWPPHAGGRFYGNLCEATTSTTLAIAANILYAMPIFVPLTTTYTVIAIEITTLKAGSNIRLGIYSDTNGAPNALVLDAGIVSGGAVALVTIAINQKLTPGWYWLVALASDTPTVRATNNSGAFPMLGRLTGLDTANHVGWSVAQAYGALPNPFTGGGALLVGAAPRVMLSL